MLSQKINQLQKLVGPEFLMLVNILKHLDLKSPDGLPHTPSADEFNGGVGVEFRFVREIVWPDGRREVEGTTPKSLPAPDASHALPRPTDPTLVTGGDRGSDGGGIG